MTKRRKDQINFQNCRNSLYVDETTDIRVLYSCIFLLNFFSVVYNNLHRSQSTDLESMVPAASISLSNQYQQHHDNQQKSFESQQQLDDNSTDSSSIDDELKKHRRKLRFPFGKKAFQKNKHI